MKRGFTLVEMLIVVVVLVTLMTITFRLSSIGEDQGKRSLTISRMQRLENCLSGYYAAFGSYPPVPLHGSRNIYLKTNGQGIQSADGEEGRDIWNWSKLNETEELQAWNQVQSACLAQPVACEFPFAKDKSGRGMYENLVKAVSHICSTLADSGKESSRGYWDPPTARAKFSAGFDDLVSENITRHANIGETDWRNIQIFKFGLMSFLLPRYLVMMGSDELFYRPTCGQWCNSNTLPTDALTGNAFPSWNDVRDYTIAGEKSSSDYARVANVPSQAVCARWLPNLAGECLCNHSIKVLGIEINNGSESYNLGVRTSGPVPRMRIYSPNSGSGENYSNQYVLDGITMADGWGTDFFYYSAPPYQSYVLWSAGPNERTFPPWLDRKSMTPQANRCIGLWIEDDVTHLTN